MVKVMARDPDKVFDKVLQWCQSRDFRGYNKHDGLNSPILDFFCGWSKWPAILAIQLVMRFPVNIRPLLLTRTAYNPKGLSLFVRAMLAMYEVRGDQQLLAEAERLLARLSDIVSPGEWSGACWGYHYPWVDPGFYALSNTPNAVVTSFVCEAFLDAYEVTGKIEYLDVVRSAIGFFENDLTILKDEGGELCLSYMPMPMTMRVMDVSILIGAVVARFGKLSGDRSRDEFAFRLTNYVVQRQTDDGAWFYTDPPGDSHITHDNYHTGFILDALMRYMNAVGDFEWQGVYNRGLEFYALNLFNEDGSPRWMHDVDFPHDIHGAAQGVITFSRHEAEYPGLAEKVLDWTMENMYHEDGRFFYQQGRFFTRRFTLMRWCNGWMLFALSRFIKHGG
jgi:uncharacterized protein YyaL (SSP411 family)